MADFTLRPARLGQRSDTGRDATQRGYWGARAALEACHAELDKAGSRGCCTVEDKDPNTLWFVNPVFMLGRWLAMLSRSPHRWKVSHAGVNAVLAWYRMLYDGSIPKSLRRKGEGTFSRYHLPYIYPTVKLKCWSGAHEIPLEGRHVCHDPQHSCFRNVCSFARLPSRGLYKALGRAARFVCDLVTPGWSFTNLDKAFPDVVSQFSTLDLGEVQMQALWLLHGSPWRPRRRRRPSVRRTGLR